MNVKSMATSRLNGAVWILLLFRASRLEVDPLQHARLLAFKLLVTPQVFRAKTDGELQVLATDAAIGADFDYCVQSNDEENTIWEPARKNTTNHRISPHTCEGFWILRCPASGVKITRSIMLRPCPLLHLLPCAT